MNQQFRFDRAIAAMRHIAYFSIFLLLLNSVSGCSSGGSATTTPTPPPPVVSITISPTSGTVQTGTMMQFSATVSGTTNTAATWQVNGVTGGATATGTVSISGLYTAPSAVPSPATVTITAISSADSTKSATASVTITAPPVFVAVTPSTANVRTLYTQQFTATVSNTANTAVVWSVNGTTGGSAQVGTVSTVGLYMAPSVVPSPAVITVTATSAADTTKSSSAQVTVQPPPVPTGTWSYLGPGGSGYRAQLVADPRNAQTLYATSTVPGGLFKTTDLGRSWSQLLAPNGVTFSILIAPASGTLYLLYSDHFQTSTDGGKGFSASVPYPGALYIGTTAFTVAVDPKNDQTLYVLTSSSLMRSRDGGTTWTNLTAPPNPYFPLGNSVPLGMFKVSNANSSVLMCASLNGLAISKDGGLTWQVQNIGDPNFSNLTQVVQDPNNPSRLLVIGFYANSIAAYSRIYASLDGGLTWAHQTSGSLFDQLVEGQTGRGIYFEDQGSLVATLDAGATYSNIGPPNDPSGYTAVFSPLSANTIAYQGLNDIAVSQDGGKTWTVSETGLNAQAVGQVAYAGTTGPLYVASLLSRYSSTSGMSSSELWRAADANGVWSRPLDMYSNLPILKFDVDPQNPLHLLGIEQQTVIGPAEASAVSNDGGATWTEIPYATGMQGQFPLFNFSAIHFGAPNSNSAFACGDFGIARLSTVANTWTIINNGIATGAGCTALGVDRLTSGTVYATTSAGVYKSIDGGNNWSFLFQAPGDYAKVLVDPKNSNNVFLSGGSSMRSTDGGKTWIPMNVGGLMAMNPVNPNLMYAISSNTLYASTDAGVTWGSILSPISFMEDVTVTASGVVVISTNGSGVVAFTPN